MSGRAGLEPGGPGDASPDDAFCWQRLRAALDLNLGRYDHLIDRELYLYPLLRRGALIAEGPWSWTQNGGTGLLAPEGARMEAAGVIRVGALVIEVRSGEIGRVVLLRGDEPVWQIEEPPQRPSSGRYRLVVGDVPATALWIMPAEGSDASKGKGTFLTRVVVEAPAAAQ